ncbi:VOC family protein [Pyruvatibacter mobilis]|uniref:VOC family protein n=1 Tax=Pyruvatibacter mobilis TaxID=1712261 RepID=UPI003BAFC903
MSRLFGPIRQNGYVVRDIEAAMSFWTEVHGVGPWFYVDWVQADHFLYRGEASPVEMSIALANSGDLQLELIQQRNDAPSMYRDFIGAGHEGLQHVAYWTTEFDALYQRALDAGLTIGHEGQIGGPRGRFAYFSQQGHPGSVIEISDISGSKGDLFAHIRDTARGWDGTDPVRRVG